MKRPSGKLLAYIAYILCAALFIVGSNCSASETSGSDAKLDAVRARLAEKVTSVESIQADFVQLKHLSIFSEVVASKGNFAFQRPDRLRWELVEPVKTGFILDGGKGRRWHELQEGEAEFDAQRDPVLGAVAEQLLAWASTDFSRLEKSYHIALTKAHPAAFRLTPQSETLARYLEAIEVVFAGDETHVVSVTVREKGGDYTEMLFGNVRLNEPLPKETF
jgi:outer membrane lipoprotein-sorting protein